MRRLVAKPKVSDLFGIKGRRWLEELELPAAERETVDSALRQLEFCEPRDRRDREGGRGRGPGLRGDPPAYDRARGRA